MKRKTAIKKIMGLGSSRNYAEYYLYALRQWAVVDNSDAVELYKIAQKDWMKYVIQRVKPITFDFDDFCYACDLSGILEKN